MSMLFELRSIPEDQANSLRRDPSDIFFFLHGSEPYEPPKGLIQKFFGSKKEKPQRKWEPPKTGSVLNLDSNWHVLHYFLSRSAWEGSIPEGALMAGVELGSVDVGYGPAKMLIPGEVESFSNFLNSLSEKHFGAGITGAELVENEIYGGYAEWGKESTSSLWGYVEELKKFLSGAREAEEYVVMYVY